MYIEFFFLEWYQGKIIAFALSLQAEVDPALQAPVLSCVRFCLCLVIFFKVDILLSHTKFYCIIWSF